MNVSGQNAWDFGTYRYKGYDISNPPEEDIPDKIAIKIGSPEESEFWQKRAFNSGWGWRFDKKNVQYTDRNYIYLYADKTITWWMTAGGETVYHPLNDADKIQAFLDHHSKKKAPEIDGHEVKYDPGTRKVYIGCWNGSRYTISMLKHYMSEIGITHIKVRGVLINEEQIDEILEYVKGK